MASTCQSLNSFPSHYGGVRGSKKKAKHQTRRSSEEWQGIRGASIGSGSAYASSGGEALRMCYLCGFFLGQGTTGDQAWLKGWVAVFSEMLSMEGHRRFQTLLGFGWKQVHSPPLSPTPLPPEEEVLPRPYPSCPGGYVRTQPPKGLCCRVPRAGRSSPVCLP